jgi:hypothetical protein
MLRVDSAEVVVSSIHGESISRQANVKLNSFIGGIQFKTD